MTVAAQHPSYKKLAAQWQRVRDVCAGEDTVQAAGVRYLPKLKDQDAAEYSAYARRATFFNASWRTIDGFIGMLFRKPPTVTVPKGIEPYLENVTMSGISMDEFAQEVALEVLKVDNVGILVDHPSVSEPGSITKAVAEKQGLRPTLQLYPVESIINWKMRAIGNKTVLGMVVLQEEHATPKDEFEDDFETRYRVLDLDPTGNYRQRVFRVKDGKDEQIGGDIYPLMNGNPLDFVPFYFDPCCEEPPLIDLINLNLKHYVVTADYEHACHFTALPTPYVCGYQNPTPEVPVSFYIGSTAAWIFPDSQTKVGFLEFQGSGIGAIKANLDDKKTEMTILGARMLAEEKRTAETATTASIHREGENSVLANVSIQASDVIAEALKVFATWAGFPDDSIEYDLNRDFNPVGLDAPTITAYIALVQGGFISPQTFHSLMQRADLTDQTYEVEQAQIDAAPPPKITAVTVPPKDPGKPPTKPPLTAGA